MLAPCVFIFDNITYLKIKHVGQQQDFSFTGGNRLPFKVKELGRSPPNPQWKELTPESQSRTSMGMPWNVGAGIHT